MKFLLLLSATCLLFLVNSCKKEEAPSAHCANAGAFVKQVKNIRGEIYYDSNQSRYYIRVPNSFDSYDIGYTCNLAAEYQVNGQKVNFSGSYYDFGQPVSGIAGNKDYYLSLEFILPTNW